MRKELRERQERWRQKREEMEEEVRALKRRVRVVEESGKGRGERERD